jgi:hypothetical protein
MVEKHEGCKNVAILKDITKIVKKSVQFNEVGKLMDDLMKTVDKIRKNREKKLIDTSEQKQIVESEIRKVRTKINNHLDKLQENLMKELTEEETKISRKTRELLSSLDEKEKDLTEYQTTLVNIKQYASDLQTFLAMKQIESDIDTHDTSVQALVNSCNLNQTKLSCKIDTRLKRILTSIEKFGEVVFESKPCELSFVRRKYKQAHSPVSDLLPIDDLQLNLKQKIRVGRQGKRGVLPSVLNWMQAERNIHGYSPLPDGRMVFSCSDYRTVWFLDKDGVELFQIGQDKIGCRPFNTVYIKEYNSIAVSSLEDKYLTMIDIESQEVTTTISMESGISSMAVNGRAIYCITMDNKLQMLNLSDQSVCDIINFGTWHTGRVATSGYKLYYTNGIFDTVTCCDLHGTTHWEFRDENILQYPCDITVDNGGNVYVVGCYTNNIVVISHDGQRSRQLLSKKDGLKDPNVLDYDRSTNRLLVVNKNGTAFLFDVRRGQ